MTDETERYEQLCGVTEDDAEAADQAYADSGLTPAEWRALTPADREAIVDRWHASLLEQDAGPDEYRFRRTP
jgi:acyl-CoA reductase-like NAD-dependent aldehyde dehydrogenase